MSTAALPSTAAVNRSPRPGRSREQRDGVALLHQRHHGPAERRDAHAPQPAAMTLNYLADVDAAAVGDHLLHAAPLSHGSGLYTVPTPVARLS